MSTGMSVPRPRLPGVDVSDSALLATLLHEAPIGFAFIGPDGRFRRMNQVMATLTGGDADPADHSPDQVWPPGLAEAAQAAVRQVAAGDRPVAQTEHAIPAMVGQAAAAFGEPAMRYWSFSGSRRRTVTSAAWL